MPQCRQRVQACKGKERIGQIAVYVFRGTKYCAVFFDAKINVEKTKVEDATVIDESHHA